MRLSLVIPARNEAAVLGETVSALAKRLTSERIPAEIVVVDDHSVDETPTVARLLRESWPEVRCISNGRSSGFGSAVRSGLDVASGDVVAVVMADGSDDPADVVRCYRLALDGHDCVFGSRFEQARRPAGYPPAKWLCNRLGNRAIAWLFGLSYTDITNAFKLYRSSVIEAVQPLGSRGFEITVELPLKAINQGCRYATLPIRWHGRPAGRSKFRLAANAARYSAAVATCWWEGRRTNGG